MNRYVKSLLLKMELFRDLQEGRALRGKREAGEFPVFLDYEVRSVPRYGYGRPPHGKLFEILNRNRLEYARTLQRFLEFKDSLQRIPVHKPEDVAMPYWQNGFLMGLDPVSLYSFACLKNPQTYIEIGSGNSTKFMRKAIRDHGLRTRIVSIDPDPRADVDKLCDEIRRQPLEETDLTLFESLAAGDILLVDGSHRVFMNSDVTVVFLDLLPALRPGVLVYIDDIYLPLDYPQKWASRYYSEQYLLAVLLLTGAARYEVLLPCNFVAHDPELHKVLAPLWTGALAEGVSPGNGFWLVTR